MSKMKTYQAKRRVEQKCIGECRRKVLGRLATELVKILKGKNKPPIPHLDTGDFVIVVNAGKVALTERR